MQSKCCSRQKNKCECVKRKFGGSENERVERVLHQSDRGKEQNGVNMETKNSIDQMTWRESQERRATLEVKQTNKHFSQDSPILTKTEVKLSEL